VAVRHPEVSAAGRHYGVTMSHVRAGRSRVQRRLARLRLRLAKADVVPTDANLRADYASFAELQAACEAFCERVNQRVCRETGAVLADRLAHERRWLHALLVQPYVAALGPAHYPEQSRCKAVDPEPWPAHRRGGRLARAGPGGGGVADHRC
jgi:hypothetical protein